jgi:PadR family transcriptional regulator, regulatory protein PadR
MADDPMQLLQGTLDVLVLKTLTWGPNHGYGVARWIRDTTNDALAIEDGALYTSLHRMERKGWIASEWGVTDGGRRVKQYAITTAGRRALQAQASQWQRYVIAVGKILQPA